ncbi:hypothetical protein DFJ58DRAFT_861766 [Suillus subalutaceus]|uniref:uncharacterized protein n=1 Tax=Suillus subalutaceus TaxID=48586 RepID=UPI001B886F6B|nr:uncharacterized protein DFJ58DRAFT_861766 [Suillus subalutaceus]KAG1838193.1 hypothetical protein DFJ58DRAFT_861766 [Suillus subalutaceus]
MESCLLLKFKRDPPWFFHAVDIYRDNLSEVPAADLRDIARRLGFTKSQVRRKDLSIEALIEHFSKVCSAISSSLRVENSGSRHLPASLNTRATRIAAELSDLYGVQVAAALRKFPPALKSLGHADSRLSASRLVPWVSVPVDVVSNVSPGKKFAHAFKGCLVVTVCYITIVHP